tara:strand:- start:552 stop:737 length:186 start_codon:yes stop_codon:yes gene_type:complete
METYPENPKVRAGSPTDAYIRCCHERLWALIDIISPNNKRSGDCLEVVDQILKEQETDKNT